jgi:hypothetical protein
LLVQQVSSISMSRLALCFSFLNSKNLLLKPVLQISDILLQNSD